MVNSFANNFWDIDFNGTEGYDVLVTRLKDGKKLYDGFTEFVRNRARLEEDYGRKLLSVAQTSLGNDETGSLKAAWESVKKETEGVAAIHIELSRQLNELNERSLKSREKYKQERIRIDENMRRQQKEKKLSYDAVMRARKLYEQRCKESDLAKDAYGSKSKNSKEEEKLKRNMLKCKSAAETADAAYQQSVKQLEDQRKKYIVSMEDACQKFQSVEESRIQFLRNEMWLYTNHGATQVLNMDERYEECRQLLEKCNEKSDIQMFINKNNIGETRPSEIKYQNYYNKDDDLANNWETNIATNSPKSSSHPNLLSNSSSQISVFPNPNQLSSPTSHTSSQSNLSSNVPQHASSEVLTQQSSQSSSNPNLASQHRNVPSYMYNPDEDAYPAYTPDAVNIDGSNKTCHTNLDAEVRSLNPASSTRPNVKRAYAAFVYQSQSEQELTLTPGDIIYIKSIVDETWAIGTLNGKVGAFPRAFVDELP